MPVAGSSYGKRLSDGPDGRCRYRLYNQPGLRTLGVRLRQHHESSLKVVNGWQNIRKLRELTTLLCLA